MADLLTQFRERRLESGNALRSYKDDAITWFKYAAGDQWSKQDLEKMGEMDRPALTFNKLTSLINAVGGSEIVNRHDIRYIPRTTDDAFFNEIMTETVRYIRQRSHALHEESMAFKSAAICGIGCLEFWQDYSEDIAGQTKTDNVNIFELTWDPTVRKQNLLDSKYIIRGRWVQAEEAMFRWDITREDIKSESAGTDEQGVFPFDQYTDVHDQTHAHLYRGNVSWDPKTDRVLIFEYQWFDYDNFVLFLNPMTGEEEEISYDEWKDTEKTYADQGIPLQWVKYRKKVYKRAYIFGHKVLEEAPLPVQSGFTYKFITGLMEVDQDRNQFFGLVKLGKDPQNWVNKAMSHIVDVVGSNPKGALLAEEDTFLDEDQVQEDWGRPNAVIRMQNGAIAEKRFEVIHGQYPVAAERILQLSSQFVEDTIGLGPYFAGGVSDLKRTSGQAISQAKQSGMTVLAVLFDSLKRYRHEAALMYLDFVKEFMPEGEMVRISMPTMPVNPMQGMEQGGQPGMQQPMQPTGGPQMVQFQRDWVEKVKYDVIIDEVPDSPNSMREFWNSLQQTQSLGLLMNAGLLTPDLIADIIPDVPTTYRERMKQTAAQQAQQNQLLSMVPQALQAIQIGKPQEAEAVLAQIVQQLQAQQQSKQGQ